MKITFRFLSSLAILFFVSLILLQSDVRVWAQEGAATDDTQTDNDPLSGSLKREVDQLHAQVKEKEKRIQELNALIGGYKNRITDQESAVSSLQNELALLENQIEEKKLAIERTKGEIEVVTLQVQALGNQIRLQQTRIAQRQSGLADILLRIQQADAINTVEGFMARPSLSEFFAHAEELSRLERELVDATQTLKREKVALEEKKTEQEQHRLALQDQTKQLGKEQRELESTRAAKVSLVSVTQTKEEEFRRILYELRQQQQAEGDDIAALQDQLKQQLASIDSALARGDILLDWPIKVLRGISAHFHDPTYPFRKLFEHPGTDLPTDVGTPVHAAAGGYVAWTRTGKQYGNYVMIVHAGGIATVYAHLSRFAVTSDTYVERGDVIGYSGGRPGDAGAGLSTGPHLHFEVRQNGIPVNAEQFLPSLE